MSPSLFIQPTKWIGLFLTTGVLKTHFELNAPAKAILVLTG